MCKGISQRHLAACSTRRSHPAGERRVANRTQARYEAIVDRFEVLTKQGPTVGKKYYSYYLLL